MNPSKVTNDFDIDLDIIDGDANREMFKDLNGSVAALKRIEVWTWRLCERLLDETWAEPLKKGQVQSCQEYKVKLAAIEEMAEIWWKQQGGGTAQSIE